jgi:WD40 repeat protein
LALIGQNELASASADGFVKVWDLTNDKRTRTLEGHHKGVLSLVVGTNGELITGGEDQTIRVWKK